MIDNPKNDVRARLTVVEQIYYQAAGGEPVTIDGNQGQWLETDEQPYKRHVKIGKDWTAIDCGWIKEASLLVIHNAGKQGTVDLYVGNGEPESQWVIAPGKSFRGQPASLRLMVRCLGGEARITVNLFPR